MTPPTPAVDRALILDLSEPNMLMKLSASDRLTSNNQQKQMFLFIPLWDTGGHAGKCSTGMNDTDGTHGDTTQAFISLTDGVNVDIRPAGGGVCCY